MGSGVEISVLDPTHRLIQIIKLCAVKVTGCSIRGSDVENSVPVTNSPFAGKRKKRIRVVRTH